MLYGLAGVLTLTDPSVRTSTRAGLDLVVRVRGRRSHPRGRAPDAARAVELGVMLAVGYDGVPLPVHTHVCGLWSALAGTGAVELLLAAVWNRAYRVRGALKHGPVSPRSPLCSRFSQLPRKLCRARGTAARCTVQPQRARARAQTAATATATPRACVSNRAVSRHRGLSAEHPVVLCLHAGPRQTACGRVQSLRCARRHDARRAFAYTADPSYADAVWGGRMPASHGRTSAVSRLRARAPSRTARVQQSARTRPPRPLCAARPGRVRVPVGVYEVDAAVRADATR